MGGGDKWLEVGSASEDEAGGKGRCSPGLCEVLTGCGVRFSSDTWRPCITVLVAGDLEVPELGLD